MSAMDHKMSDVLAAFTPAVATEFPIQAILDHLVERVVDMLPFDSAGVTLIGQGGRPNYIAASDADALRFEKLQTELGEGPGLLAARSGHPISSADFKGDSRFPAFGPGAVAAGLAAVFTFPLCHGADQLGALGLYRRTPGDLPAAAMRAAGMLADVAAAYLISARTREELQLSLAAAREASLHDGLTGLPNRRLLLQRLDQALAHGRRTGRITAVLFIDVDRLKEVNDTYGHLVGDQLLVALTARLSAMMREGDTLARLCGDEFVVICEDIRNPVQAAAVGNRLALALDRPYVLTDVEIPISASIGLAYADRGEYTSEQILHEADIAMYQVKQLGGGRQHVFDTDQRKRLSIPLSGLESDLPGAATRGELRNEYQPIVSTSDGRITGFEALPRWSHPQRGEIPAATRIPSAARSDLINDIGNGVLGRACTDLGHWNRAGNLDAVAVTMAVNVSGRQIMSNTFLLQVRKILGDSNIRPELLTLQITESVFLRHGENAVLAVSKLRELGVKLALGSFGTGYSSLAYLKRFPVDIIKIDRSFITDLPANRVSKAVVHAIVQLAHALGMSLVAEGVETSGQRDIVADLGCDLSQGPYFGKPAPAQNVDALLHPHLDRAETRQPLAQPRSAAS